jgi:hypothetical protein
MKRIRLRRSEIFLRTPNIQIHHHRLLPAAHDHRFHWSSFLAFNSWCGT